MSAVADTGLRQPDSDLFDHDVVDQPADTSAQPRTFAGFLVRDLVLFAAGIIITLWAVWATTVLLELRQRRIVSVSLTSIIKEFVAAESRNGASPDVAAARTKAYLAATDAAMQSLSEGGATVLVSEAVVGNSVPDMTAAVSAAVKAHMAQQSAALSAPPAGPGNGN